MRAAGFYTCPRCGETIEAKSGVRRCLPCGEERPSRRIYDLRHSFASNALAAGVSSFEPSRFMGTSLRMIARVYGHLTDSSEQATREKLDQFAAGNGR